MGEVAKLNFVLERVQNAKKTAIEIRAFKRAINVKGVAERLDLIENQLDDAEAFLKQMIKDKIEDNEELKKLREYEKMEILLGGGTTD